MSKYDLKVDSEDIKNFVNRMYGDPFQSYGLITTSLIDRIINDIKEKEKMKNTIVIKQIDEKRVVASYYDAHSQWRSSHCSERVYTMPTLSAEAKCAPEDKFDFQTGAALAFERLMEKIEEANKPKPKKLVGILSAVSYGDIGELSPYHDKNGEHLYVGDVVYIGATDKVTGGECYIVKDVYGEFFICGVKNYCYSKYGKLDSAIQTKVERKKSYKDIVRGESYGAVIAQ